MLFAIGSLCFFLGPLPGFVQLVGSAADGAVFFVGSVFFTAAALIQHLVSATADCAPSKIGHARFRALTFQPRRIGWWATLIQLVGTVYFNVDTYRAMTQSFDTSQVDRLVWAPEALGSICFLISGLLAYLEVRGGGVRDAERTLEWRIAIVNLAGCVLFGLSTIASYVVPSTGDVLALAAANVTTSLGALCFLVGAVMLLRDSATAEGLGPDDEPAVGAATT
ncbi:MAG: hypothetical protein K0R88_487 [Solirubrobacterales bacterium]|nr:hypothetical protein [Solirubrobacterales bacterium]